MENNKDLLEDVNIQELTIEELSEFPLGEIFRVLKYLDAKNEALSEALDYMYESSLGWDI